MVVTCCVRDCSSRLQKGNGISFHQIPMVITTRGRIIAERTERRRREWLQKINRKSISTKTVKPWTRVCSKHFISGKAAEPNDDQNPDWVPTLHMGYDCRSTAKSEAMLKLESVCESGDNAVQGWSGSSSSEHPRPFQCGLCSVTFDLNPELVRHVESHAYAKPFQCGICKVSYYSNPELTSHVAVHNVFIFYPVSSGNDGKLADLLRSPVLEDNINTVGSGCTCSRIREKQEDAYEGDTDIEDWTEPEANTEVVIKVEQESKHEMNAVKVGVQASTDGPVRKKAKSNSSAEETASVTRKKAKLTQCSAEETTPVPGTQSSAKETAPVEGRTRRGAKVKTVGSRTKSPKTVGNMTKPVGDMTEPAKTVGNTPVLLKLLGNTTKSPKTVGHMTEPVKTVGHMTEPVKTVGHMTEPVKTVGNSPMLITILGSTTISAKNVVTTTITNLPDNMTKPAGNMTKPADNMTKPAYNMTKPAYNMTKPADNMTKPAYNMTKPADNMTKPTKTAGNTTKPSQARKRAGSGPAFHGLVEEGQLADGTWRCVECGKVLKSLKILRNHHLVHVGDRPWHCPDCPLAFKRKAHMDHHVREVHKSEDRSYSCPSPGCGAKFKSNHYLSKHIKQQHEACPKHGKKNCEVCNSAAHFKTNENRADHVKKAHQKKSGFTCPHCKFSFVRKHVMDSHMNRYHSHIHSTEDSTETSESMAHHGEKSQESHSSFVNSSQVIESDGVSVTATEMEQRSAYNSTEIERRSAYNSAGGTFKCPDCAASFSSEPDYNRHVRTEHIASMQEQNKIFCHVCGQSYSCKSLRQHMLIHQDQRPFKCSECDFSCRNQRALRDHKRVHTRETPFTCETCGRSFSRINSLTYHRNTHLDTNPIICNICKRGFNSYQALRVHKLRHAGDKRYSCEECGKRFYTLSMLKRHALTHKDVRPFVCVHCSKTYKAYSALGYHLKNSHGGAKNTTTSTAILTT